MSTAITTDLGRAADEALRARAAKVVPGGMHGHAFRAIRERDGAD